MNTKHTPKNITNKWWLGVEFYFRNNSTNKPSMRHIINQNSGKSYCGFQDFCAQSIIGDESDHADPIISTCKKCLKLYNKTK